MSMCRYTSRNGHVLEIEQHDVNVVTGISDLFWIAGTPDYRIDGRLVTRDEAQDFADQLNTTGFYEGHPLLVVVSDIILPDGTVQRGQL